MTDHHLEPQPIIEDGLQVGTADSRRHRRDHLGLAYLDRGIVDEVALVRSAFGRPSTVNDGETIMSAPLGVYEAGPDAT